jgi:hypothetical protein
MPNDMTLNTPAPTPNAAPVAVAGPRLIPDRTFAAKGSQRGVLTTIHLEAVRDHLAAVTRAQQAEEMDRSFSNMHLSFDNGRVYAQFITPNGLGERMLVHKTAYGQMASNLLPNRGGGFLLDQSALGAVAERVATLSWATFARQDTKPRMFRTVMTRDPADGVVKRMIRSQHSQGYAPYDSLRFVNDLLDTAEVRDLPVLQYHLSDGAMRLRFALKPGEEIALREPTPMMEAWNSETGQRSVGLSGGIWKLICTNGMGSWEKSSEWRWRHYGNSERISDGVRSAVDEIRVTSGGVLEAYNRALDVAIDDAAAWLERELIREQAPAVFTASAVRALTDETTTPGGLLASAVDAVTLAAQDADDLFAQAEYEAFAARIMRRGLANARDGRILVEA